METFTPLSAALGGGLIGLAAAILWLGNGRIAGISGIFGQLLPANGNAAWRLLFLVALIAGAWLTARLFPGIATQPLDLVQSPNGLPTPVWIGLAGLLTGLGTRIGNGCTSGHGVCGLARLSLRSLVAVAVFFGTAVVTVAITGVV